MKIAVKVKPNSKTESVEKADNGEYIVRVKAPPVEGRANEAVRNVLAGHFGVSKSRIVIKHGSSGKRKLVDILT